MAILHQYTNGNCEVSLCDDGTKVREWPDGEAPQPVFPESIDLKITNRCDEGCEWCHESASPDGAHASLDRISQATMGLPSGVEMAIGGGNPLAYPRLNELLSMCRARGLVANMTVHSLAAVSVREVLVSLVRGRCLHGLGLSDPVGFEFVSQVGGLLPNVVCHAVIGIDEPFDIMRLRADGHNVLLLGYKRHGRGASYYGDAVKQNIARWQYFIGTLLRKADGVLSFDNLALEQLDIKNRLPADVWSDHYMGDDGAFTMYFDAVRNEYAASSVSNCYAAGSMTLRDMFAAMTDA